MIDKQPDPMALFTAQLLFLATKPKAKPDYKAHWWKKKKTAE